jgi:hypothetical protein
MMKAEKAGQDQPREVRDRALVTQVRYRPRSRIADVGVATPQATATVSSTKLELHSSRPDDQPSSATASEGMCTMYLASSLDASDEGYTPSLVEHWAAGIAPPPPADEDIPPIVELEDELEDEGLIQSQMAMPDEALDSDEEEEGLTGDQAVSVLSKRGVNFKILNTVDFDLLLSKAFGCGAESQAGA